MPTLRSFCVSVGTGYPLVGLVGVDADFQPLGGGHQVALRFDEKF